MSEIATLEVNGKKLEFPVIVGSENEVAIDIKALRGASGGVVTIDPGYKNTGSCQSAITFLNGEEGVLRYRGYSIEELAEKADFLEVAYLLIFGALCVRDANKKSSGGIPGRICRFLYVYIYIYMYFIYIYIYIYICIYIYILYISICMHSSGSMSA